jgi:tetratricopeptide (TPR) repeat protein
MRPHLYRFLIFATVLVGTVALAQQQTGMVAKPCRIRINITDERQNPVRDITVELQDSVGLAAAGTSKQTGQDGRVEFNSIIGAHRLRITGSNIHEYEGEFEVMPNESVHVENIRVKIKLDATNNGSPGNAVPSTRLKIPSAAEKLYDSANKSMEKQDWKSAEEDFRKAIQLYPDFDLAYNGLGTALSHLNDEPGAKASFEKAVAITPEYAMANRNLARILINDREWKRADEVLRKSLQTEPINAWALTNAAYAELQLHDFTAAAANAQKVHDIPHTGYENAHFIAALALEELGAKDGARAQYDLYLKEAPTGANAPRAQDAVARLSQTDRK